MEIPSYFNWIVDKHKDVLKTGCVAVRQIRDERNNSRILPESDFQRTIPHFQKFDFSSEATGYIKNGYIKGLTPPELIFENINGR